jgi:membrane fusion protein (multidrug efflux system)
MNASAVVVDRDVAAPTSPGVARIGVKRLAIYCAIGLAAAAVVAYGYRWVTVGRFLESTDDAYVGGDVTVIAPKVAGFIEQVAVTDNQRVEAGELLVKLDDRDYRAALARTEAAADAQRATLENLEATRRLQQAFIAQARAGITAADAEVSRTMTTRSASATCQLIRPRRYRFFRRLTPTTKRPWRRLRRAGPPWTRLSGSWT